MGTHPYPLALVLLPRRGTPAAVAPIDDRVVPVPLRVDLLLGVLNSLSPEVNVQALLWRLLPDSNQALIVP